MGTKINQVIDTKTTEAVIEFQFALAELNKKWNVLQPLLFSDKELHLDILPKIR